MVRLLIVKRTARMFSRATAVLFLGLLLLAGTSGYWLPWAAPWLLGLAEVRVESAARGDDGKLVLRQVRFENPAVDLTVAELRSPMPLSLAWHGLRRTATDAGGIRLEGWRIGWRGSSEDNATDIPPPGPAEALKEVDHWLARADRWLPPISLRKGSLLPPETETPILLPEASFRSRKLVFRTEARGNLPAIRVEAVFGAGEPWRIRARAAGWDSILRAELARETGGPRLQGGWDGATGTGSFSLQWSREDWIPATAALAGTKLRFPEGMVALPEELRSVTVDSLEANWDGTDYALETRLRGGAAGEELTMDLSLGGNREALVVRTLRVSGSWLNLTLEPSVRLDPATLEPESPFRFSAFADLDGQEYFPASGEIGGILEADLSPAGRYPVRFVLAGRDLRADGRSLRSLDLRGRFDYPTLTVESLRIALPEGSVAEMAGSADFTDRTVALEATANLEAADLDRLADGATGLEAPLRVEASFEGPWERPVHRGFARTGSFVPPGMAPLALELDWTGEGLDQGTTDVSADTGKESVRMRSEWFRKGPVLRSRIVDLRWDKADESFLVLDKPAEVRMDLEALSQWPWQGLRAGTISLDGNGRRLGLHWAPPETASVRATGLRTTDLAGWFSPDASLPDLSLETLSAEVEDFEPVLVAETSLDASWRPEPDARPVVARLRGRFDASGVDLTEISATYGETPLLGGDLELPVTFRPWIRSGRKTASAGDSAEHASGSEAPNPGAPKRESFWKIVSGGDLGGSLDAKWSPGLREQIHEWGGPYVESAGMELRLGGTVRRPEARLHLDLHGMRLDGESDGGDFPEIRGLETEFLVNGEKVLLRRGLLELRDSGIRLSGELPYPGILKAYEERGEWDFRKALRSLRADVELRNWNASVWKDRLPLIFRPQGKLTGAVGVDPGLKLRGKVRISDFSLRPTLYSSPIDGVHATLRFDGRRVHLEDAGATAGGGDLAVSGTVDLDSWLDPRYEFKITGDNIPVARTPDLILRSDANLTFAQTPAEDTPLLQGTLNLRNSTYLVAFDPFAPNIESGPGSQPPYFSVKEKPFADWRIDLSIEGQDFLRVRSSLFATELSANLRLTRTLGDPLLLGSVRAKGGRVRFPGMNMRIESLEAFVTPEEPNRLRIEADAIGQNRLYVVTMNVSGSADDPQIQFSSTPTLTNAQIIRLLATGSLQGGGAGALGLYLGQALLGPGNGEETLADRLSVEIGREVTENGRSTVDVTYRLTDRWSVEGEYDRFDAYNLNLVRILLER